MIPTIIGKTKKQNQRERLKNRITINRNKHSTGNFFLKEERQEHSEERKKDLGKPFIKIELYIFVKILFYLISSSMISRLYQSGNRNGRKLKAGKSVHVTKLDDVNLH